MDWLARERSIWNWMLVRVDRYGSYAPSGNLFGGMSAYVWR